MRLIVNADDGGLTRGITETILAAVDRGALTGVSLVPNGHAFAYAAEELRRRPHIRVAAHLNLVEGTPASSSAAIPLLVDSHGQLNNSFQSLWLRYARSGPQLRRALATQVSLELQAQLRTFADAFGNAGLSVDSHQHFHMIPFVFDALLGLGDSFPLRYVRLPREDFLRPRDAVEIRTACSSNAVKIGLLNALSERARPALTQRGISFCDRFFGVLFSGRMSESLVRRALARLDRSLAPDALVEVLLHPGQASTEELGAWRRRPELQRYYSSPWRAAERKTLLDPSFSRLVASYQRA